MKTQNEMIKEHLKSGKSITSLEAIQKYGITRTSARIWDLKDSGMKIKSQMIVVKNRFSKNCNVKKYYL